MFAPGSLGAPKPGCDTGMLPERKVEFVIELILGTTPISKRAYRVSGPELVELKKQIDELSKKGYIKPSTHLGPPLSCSWRRKMALGGCVSIIEL